MAVFLGGAADGSLRRQVRPATSPRRSRSSRRRCRRRSASTSRGASTSSPDAPRDPAFNDHVAAPHAGLGGAPGRRDSATSRRGYDGTERRAARREVRPFLLEPSLQTHALYLIGWDETATRMRTFKIERIRDLSLTPRTLRAAGGAAPSRRPSGGAGTSSRTSRRPRSCCASRRRSRARVARGDLAPEPGGRASAGRRRSTGGPRVAGTIEIRLWILSWGDEVEVARAGRRCATTWRPPSGARRPGMPVVAGSRRR